MSRPPTTVARLPQRRLWAGDERLLPTRTRETQIEQVRSDAVGDHTAWSKAYTFGLPRLRRSQRPQLIGRGSDQYVCGLNAWHERCRDLQRRQMAIALVDFRE